VSWACAEGVAPPRQFDKAADATADAPEEEAATLVQSPVDREREVQRDDEHAATTLTPHCFKPELCFTKRFLTDLKLGFPAIAGLVTRQPNKIVNTKPLAARTTSTQHLKIS